MLGQIVTEGGVKKIKKLTADVGAGLPVGTIIVVCSNQIPSNYLPLGTQFDTSLYPVLYALLGTDTTPTASALGLPTLSSGQYAIKATSGLSENQQDNVINALNVSRSYSTEETLTGKTWIDGKPIYRQVFSGLTFNVGTSWGNTGYTLQNCDTVINAVVQQLSSGDFTFASVSVQVVFTNGAIKVQSAQSFTNCSNIILEYTKTTD